MIDINMCTMCTIKCILNVIPLVHNKPLNTIVIKVNKPIMNQINQSTTKGHKV